MVQLPTVLQLLCLSVLVSGQYQGSPGHVFNNAYQQPTLGYTQSQILGYYGQQYLARPNIQYYQPINNPGQALPRVAPEQRAELPVSVAQTQQQQRQAWQRQIDHVKEKERQLREKSDLKVTEPAVIAEHEIKKTGPGVTFGQGIKTHISKSIVPLEKEFEKKLDLNGIIKQEKTKPRRDSLLPFEMQLKKKTGLSKIIEQEKGKTRPEPVVTFQRQEKKKIDLKETIEQDIKKSKTEPLVTFEVIELVGKKKIDLKGTIEQDNIKKSKTEPLVTFEVIELVGRKKIETKEIYKTNDDVTDISVNYTGEDKYEKEIIPGLKEIEESNLYRKSSYIQEAENILKKLSKSKTVNTIEDDNKTLQNVTKRPKEAKFVKNGNRKEGKLDENQIENILLKSIKTKEGLKEIIKKIFKGKAF